MERPTEIEEKCKVGQEEREKYKELQKYIPLLDNIIKNSITKGVNSSSLVYFRKLKIILLESNPFKYKIDVLNAYEKVLKDLESTSLLEQSSTQTEIPVVELDSGDDEDKSKSNILISSKKKSVSFEQNHSYCSIKKETSKNDLPYRNHHDPHLEQKQTSRNDLPYRNHHEPHPEQKHASRNDLSYRNHHVPHLEQKQTSRNDLPYRNHHEPIPEQKQASRTYRNHHEAHPEQKHASRNDLSYRNHHELHPEHIQASRNDLPFRNHREPHPEHQRQIPTNNLFYRNRVEPPHPEQKPPYFNLKKETSKNDLPYGNHAGNPYYSSTNSAHRDYLESKKPSTAFSYSYPPDDFNNNFYSSGNYYYHQCNVNNYPPSSETVGKKEEGPFCTSAYSLNLPQRSDFNHSSQRPDFNPPPQKSDFNYCSYCIFGSDIESEMRAHLNQLHRDQAPNMYVQVSSAAENKDNAVAGSKPPVKELYEYCKQRRLKYSYHMEPVESSSDREYFQCRVKVGNLEALGPTKLTLRGAKNAAAALILDMLKEKEKRSQTNSVETIQESNNLKTEKLDMKTENPDLNTENPGGVLQKNTLEDNLLGNLEGANQPSHGEVNNIIIKEETVVEEYFGDTEDVPLSERKSPPEVKNCTIKKETGSKKNCEKSDNSNKKDVDQQNHFYKILIKKEPKIESNEKLEDNTNSELTDSELSGRDLYICGLKNCIFSAETEAELHEHLLVCDFSRHSSSLTCPHCGTHIQKNCTFLKHLHLHGEKRYSCSLCDYASGQEKSVVLHVKIKHKIKKTSTVKKKNGPKGYFEIFPEGEDFLKEIKKTEVMKTEETAAIEPKNKPTRKKISSSSKTKSPAKTKTKTKAKAKTETKTGKTEFGYRCGYCLEYESPKYKNITDHLYKVHQTKSYYKCGVCDARNNSPSYFISHFKAKHKGEEVSIKKLLLKIDSNGEVLNSDAGIRKRKIAELDVKKEDEEEGDKKPKKIKKEDSDLNQPSTSTQPCSDFSEYVHKKKRIMLTKQGEDLIKNSMNISQDMRNFVALICDICGEKFEDSLELENHHKKCSFNNNNIKSESD